MPKVETKSIDDILPDPNNANKHTQRGHQIVENSIRRRGVGRGILAAGKNTDKPVIMAGNLTAEKARDAGIDEVVIVHTTGNQLVVTVRDDLDPTSPEAIALGIEDNEAGKLSYNPDIDLLAAMSAGDNGVLSKLKEDDKIFGNMLAGMGVKESEPVDAEPQTDRAAELAEKWQTKSGQLWKLGDHRLLIGDCTVRENVERLMGGERARLEFSDPPYEFETGGGGILKEAQHMKDIKAARINEFDPASIELMTDTAVFCCNKKLVPAYIELANKNNQAWDLCFYKKENTPPNFGGHLMTDTEYLPVIGKQSPNPGMEKNVYSKAYIGGLDENHVVAWQKPIGLVEKFIKLFSSNGEVIIDRFACTGTTIIAAHNLNRRCYAMEISEKYGAVILERFFTATGIQPELVTE